MKKMKTKTRHVPTLNEIISDISGIAFKWPKETRAMVFRAVNAHGSLVEAVKLGNLFLESLPSGWLGKTTGNIGLLNDFLIESKRALALAGEQKS
jgi:hypothetical protein